jgi:hypothetical protein
VDIEEHVFEVRLRIAYVLDARTTTRLLRRSSADSMLSLNPPMLNCLAGWGALGPVR